MQTLQKFGVVLLWLIAVGLLIAVASNPVRLTTQVTGTLARANGGTGRATIGVASDTFLSYCGAAVGTGNGTTYVLPPAAAALIACTATGVAEIPMTYPCTAKNLYVTANLAGAVSGSGVMALFKNNSATALTCTLGTGTSCNDTTHTVSFAQGDLWSMRVTTGQASDTTSSLKAIFQCN